MAAIDRVLARYGSLGAVSRANQLSNWFIENELTQLQTMGFIIPAIFLGVSAFLLNIVLTRLIAVQREQIAALKALGYTNREIGGALCLVGRCDCAGGHCARGARQESGSAASITTLYNDFFRFPTLRYVLAPAIVVEGAAISICAAGAVAPSAPSRAPCGFRLPKPCGPSRRRGIA